MRPIKPGRSDFSQSFPSGKQAVEVLFNDAFERLESDAFFSPKASRKRWVKRFGREQRNHRDGKNIATMTSSLQDFSSSILLDAGLIRQSVAAGEAVPAAEVVSA